MRAATRGDGIYGEDVTENAKTIKSIPLVLPEKLTLTVEGEVYMNKYQFEKLNKEKEEKGEESYANPRNAASGALRQLDPKETARRNLDSFIYELALADSIPDTQCEELEYLTRLGFKVNKEHFKTGSLEKIIQAWESWQKKRDDLPYLLDGLVLKVNRRDLQEILGYTSKAPRYAVAFKFPEEEAVTIVKRIVFQVGRTGVITPVAELEPVKLAGTIVSRATLHNEDEIKRLDVREGDTVVIKKAGDIIPDIVRVIKELRPKNSKKFVWPKRIPECGDGGEIERKEGEVAWRCKNKNSFTQRLKKLSYFASKSAADMEGISEKIIKKFMQAGLVNSYADFYKLQKGDIMELEGFKEKSAENILHAIDKARKIRFDKLLVGLSITHLGQEAAKLLALRFKSVDELCDATQEQIESIKGVGPTLAESIKKWCKDETSQKDLQDLLKYIEIEPYAGAQNQNSELTGKTFVITGTLSIPRAEMKYILEKAGAHVSSSLSKNTDFLLAGENPGSKLKKAQDLGIKIIDEKEVFAMLSS